MFSTAGILHNTEYIRFARFCLHEYNAYISYVGTPNGSPQLCGFVVVPPAISMVYNSFFSLSRWQIRIIRVSYGVHDRKVVQVQELRLSLSQPPKRVFEAVYYARFFEVQKWTPFAPSFWDFIFELACTSVEAYARLYVKTSTSLFSYFTETTRTTYQVPVPAIYSKQQFAADPDRAALRKDWRR